MMALCTYALKACSVFTVVEGSISQDFRSWASCVCTRNTYIALVEMSVGQGATGTFLGSAIELGSNFDGTSKL